MSNGAQFVLNYHEGSFTNNIYRVGPKIMTPLLYQNVSVFWAFLGLFLTKCDKFHKFWIFLAYKLDFGAILAVHRSFHEAYKKMGCYRAKKPKIQKSPNSILVMAWMTLCVKNNNILVVCSYLGRIKAL